MKAYMVYAECASGDILLSLHETWRGAMDAASAADIATVRRSATYHHDRKASSILRIKIASFRDGRLFETETVGYSDD